MPSTTPINWPDFYAEINRATPIPVQTLASYQPVTVVADTLVVLDDVLAKCKALPVSPKVISVYADVIQIIPAFPPSSITAESCCAPAESR